jgi:hypothetical protein
MVRLCATLGQAAFAVAISRAGSTTELHCLFSDGDHARKTADALHAGIVPCDPWASCTKVLLDQGARERALSIARPSTKFEGETTSMMSCVARGEGMTA